MEESGIRLLALDLDGTLTNSQKEISGRNKTALYEAEKLGVRVALASGRPALGIRRLADELWLSQRGGFIMAYNGGEIIDCQSGKIIFRRTLPEALGEYTRRDPARFHMPGHKRNPLSVAGDFPVERDITEIHGFDNLHHRKRSQFGSSSS